MNTEKGFTFRVWLPGWGLLQKLGLEGFSGFKSRLGSSDGLFWVNELQL